MKSLTLDTDSDLYQFQNNKPMFVKSYAYQNFMNIHLCWVILFNVEKKSPLSMLESGKIRTDRVAPPLAIQLGCGGPSWVSLAGSEAEPSPKTVLRSVI